MVKESRRGGAEGERRGGGVEVHLFRKNLAGLAWVVPVPVLPGPSSLPLHAKSTRGRKESSGARGLSFFSTWSPRVPRVKRTSNAPFHKCLTRARTHKSMFGFGGGKGAASAGAAPPPMQQQPYGGAPQQGLGMSMEDAKQAFREFDLDKNGYVGAAEISHILASLGEKVTDDEVDEMILMADLDGDGQVSFDEFFKLISGFTGPPAPSMGGASAAMGGAAAMGGGAAGMMMGGGLGGGVAPPPPMTMGAGGGGTPMGDLESFQRMHNLDDGALKVIYKKFLEADKDGTGLVDINAFCNLLQVGRNEYVERLFAMFDNDRSGLVDLKEFIIGLSNVSQTGRDNKVKFAFQIFDLDGSGYIDENELRKIVKATNMASEKQLDRKVKWLMSQVDKNNDGTISFDEFVLLARRFPNIVFPAFSLVSNVSKVMGKKGQHSTGTSGQFGRHE